MVRYLVVDKYVSCSLNLQAFLNDCRSVAKGARFSFHGFLFITGTTSQVLLLLVYYYWWSTTTTASSRDLLPPPGTRYRYFSNSTILSGKEKGNFRMVRTSTSTRYQVRRV